MTSSCSPATACRNSNPALAARHRELPVDEAILDGEVAWDRSSGYHVFDILWLDGLPVTALPLEERRALLQSLPLTPPLHRVDLAGRGGARGSAPRREGWEGVIAKRRGSPYEHRRSKHWLKMKCEASQELVVGGFTDPQGARVGLGALLVGYYDGDDFVFAGKLGTGFDTDAPARSAAAARCARATGARRSRRATGLPQLRAHWVRPEIVVQVGVHRVDRPRQAAASAPARRPLRQEGARRRPGAADDHQPS